MLLDRSFLTILLCISLSYPLLAAGPEKHIDRALRQYGKDVEKIVSQSQQLQQEVLGDVEDFLDNPETFSPHPPAHKTSSSPESISPAYDIEEEGEVIVEKSGCSSCKTQKIEHLRGEKVEYTHNPRPSVTHGIDLRKAAQPPSSASLKRTSSSAKRSFLEKESLETVVFISLSMPRLALQQLDREASRNNVRLVLQGLHHNSFKDTSQKFQELGISADIDPALFDTFKISRVPTFVRYRVQQGQPLLKNHDQLAGNVPLSYALERFDKEGDVPRGL